MADRKHNSASQIQCLSRQTAKDESNEPRLRANERRPSHTRPDGLARVSKVREVPGYQWSKKKLVREVETSTGIDENAFRAMMQSSP